MNAKTLDFQTKTKIFSLERVNIWAKECGSEVQLFACPAHSSEFDTLNITQKEYFLRLL